MKFFSISSSLSKNYPNFSYPKLILNNLSHDILHLASLSKRLQWYEEEEKRTTYIFYAWMSATTLLFLSLVLWRICLSNMRKQTNKQKLFVKCLWMNWLIATNIYNVNKNAWGNIYIAEKNIKARTIWPNFKSLLLEKNQHVPIICTLNFRSRNHLLLFSLITVHLKC